MLTRKLFALSYLLLFYTGTAQAVVINFDYLTLSSVYGISSTNKKQQLETLLNDRVLNPIGVELEVASHTGGTTAVDDFSIEGPGLTVIGGAGFILRFDSEVSNVTLRFGSHKDDFTRNIYGFSGHIDYLRGPAPGSQNTDGNFAGWTMPLSSAVDFDTGVVAGAPLNLSLQNVSSLYANTTKFLTSLEAIEVDFTPVPAPASVLLLLFGISGMTIWRRLTRRIS